MKTIIRCGKLQENGEEDNERTLLLEKSHSLLSKWEINSRELFIRYSC